MVDQLYCRKWITQSQKHVKGQNSEISYRHTDQYPRKSTKPEMNRTFRGRPYMVDQISFIFNASNRFADLKIKL